MSIHEQLADELRGAMRAKDRPRVNVVRQIESEVSIARSAPGFKGEVDDALYRRVIGSYVKKMRKAKSEYEGLGERGRAQADKLAYEVEYLERWLPKTLDYDQTRALVRAAIAELGASDPKMIGRVIGHVMKSGEELDGGTVNRMVREELG